ncbi:hypothetical protein CMI37_39460 [Candidatus Pacearchaeota archaeon]|nr:hypothetical protein [Candidatus Pacearchaeota archaeon]
MKKQQVLTKEQEAFMEMPQDKVDEMIEQFIAQNPQTLEPRELKGVRPLIGPHGRPRKHFTKTIAMIQNGDILTRANRGRPAKNEVRIRVEVPHNFVVMRPPVTYYFNKGGDLAKK